MELEEKSSSYLFWLSEYLARKLLVNVGPNANILLFFFKRGAFESRTEYTLKFLEQKNPKWSDEFTYQPEPIEIATFINSGMWKTLDASWMKKFEEALFHPQKFLCALPGMHDEIDKLAAYIPANTEEIKLIIKLVRPPGTEPVTLARRCGRGTGLMSRIFHDRAQSFTDTTVTVLDNEGTPLVLISSHLEVKDAVLHLHNVSIDLTANMEDILADITSLVCVGRNRAAAQDTGKADMIARLNAFISSDCPGYGPCSGGKCQIDERYSMEAKVLRKAGTSGYAYASRSDDARAMGLWLWDYVRENGCSVGAAVRAVRKQDFFKRKYVDRTDDRGLERWCARTKQCIEQGKVLSMS